MSGKCPSLHHLSVLPCHSTPILTSTSLFFFSLNGSFLAYFFQVPLSLFLLIQNIFSCLQNWTLPHYSSIPLSVSSLLLLSVLNVTICDFKVLCGSSLFVAELYNSTKVLLSFWYLVFHFFYFHS